MSKSSDEGEQDRLTSEEFVDLIPHLPLENILQIEFFSTEWKLLILEEQKKRLYRCNLCKIILIGPKSVLSHVGGKKHIGSMDVVKYFYHPEYTFTKAKLEKAYRSSTCKNDDSNVGSEKKDSPGKSAVSQSNTNLKASSKNANTNNEKKETHATSKNLCSTQNTSVERSNQKSGSANNAKCSATNKKTSESTLKDAKPVTTGDRKSSNSNSVLRDVEKGTLDTLKDDGKANDKKSESNSKSVVRLVPISKLQSKPQSIPNETTYTTENVLQSKTSKTEVGKIGNTANETINTCITKVDENQQLTEKNTKVQCDLSEEKLNQQTKPKDKCVTKQISDELKHKELKFPNKSLNEKKEIEILKSKNPNELKPKRPDSGILERNENDKLNKDNINPKEKSIEQCPLEIINSEDNLNKDATRKFVKNPLAAKKNNEAAEKIQNESVNTKLIPGVIVIDDNDDEIQSKGNNSENIKETEPPTKKQKFVSTTLKGREAQTHKVVTTDSRHNLVVIPTRSKLTPTKNKEKTSEDPIFAVKSVTDTMVNEEFFGFVGVEYVIKICRNGNPIKYECGLCELILGGQSMQNHLLGYSHRLKFCEKHFPTAIQQFRQYIVNVPSDEHYKVMIPVLQKLTAAIEEHHGRSLPFVCDEFRYNSERHRVLTDVFARRHASEQRGPTFTHVIDSKQVDEFILRKDSIALQPNTNKITFDIIAPEDTINKDVNPGIKRHQYAPPTRSNQNIVSHPFGIMQSSYPMQSLAHPYTSQNTFVDDETHKRMVDNFLKANNSSFSQHKSSRSNRNEREHRSSQPLKRSYSPPGTSFVVNKHRHHSLDIWSSYCRLVDSKLKILREHFQKYRANPESHPSYKDEWLRFWHRRKTELTAKGIDYRNYDFQPDWVPYFNNRINELYDESFEKLKIEAREELFLPMTNNYLSDPKYFVHVQTDNYSPPEKKATRPATTNHLNTSTMGVDPKTGTPSSYNANQYQMTTPFTSTGQSLNTADSKKKLNSQENQMQDESAPTVVSVLRLLTALEEYLGSLGPKIVELLSKALQAEKNNQGRAQVLLTEENCTLLETAMEKFKGLIIAGILDIPKERAVKKAISKVTALLEYTKEMRDKHSSLKKCEKESNLHSNTINQKPVQNVNEKLKQALQSVSNANDISKVIHLIEEKIAAALKAQGRTDVDRDHLEQLAAVCVLLEKKKRQAGNVENKDLILHKPSLQQPLSDALKKIVGSLSVKSTEQECNKKSEVQHITNLNSQHMFPSVLGSSRTDDISMHNLRSQSQNSSRIDELNNINNSNSQGNFSSMYSKNNNQTWLGENPNFGPNLQTRSWSQQQQQQQSVPPVLGWSQIPSHSWKANEPTSTAGSSSKRGGYVGPQPPIQERFRYN